MSSIGFLVYDFSHFGGAERSAANLMNELSINNNVYLFSMFKEYSENAYYLSDEIKVCFIYDYLGHILKSIPRCVSIIRKNIKDNRIDYLVCLDVTTALVGVLSTIGTHAKCIISDHTSIYNKEMYRLKNLRFYCWVGVHFSYRYVSLTESSKHGILKKYHVNPNRFIVIPNWVDENAFISVKYNSSVKNIITVGRADTVKNYEALIHIAEKVKEFAPGWEWHIWGDFNSEYGRELLDLIHKKHIDDFLIHKGTSKNLYEIYKDYSFYVLTSKYEGLPMVLLEAKANRLPAIAFDCKTGPSEMICSGIDGLLIPDRDINRMIDGIKYLIENKNVREDYSFHSFDSLSNFSKNEVLSLWNNLLCNESENKK